MRNYCNSIALEQWDFSLIWNTYMWKLITISMLTKITKQGRQASSKTMAERFLDFQVEEIQELNENSENQNTKKGTST